MLARVLMRRIGAVVGPSVPNALGQCSRQDRRQLMASACRCCMRRRRSARGRRKLAKYPMLAPMCIGLVGCLALARHAPESTARSFAPPPPKARSGASSCARARARHRDLPSDPERAQPPLASGEADRPASQPALHALQDSCRPDVAAVVARARAGAAQRGPSNDSMSSRRSPRASAFASSRSLTSAANAASRSSSRMRKIADG